MTASNRNPWAPVSFRIQLPQLLLSATILAGHAVYAQELLADLGVVVVDYSISLGTLPDPRRTVGLDHQLPGNHESQGALTNMR